MKKLLYSLVLVLLFISCSGNDSEEIDPLEAFYREAIIGSWSFNTVTVDNEIFVYQHTDGCEKDLFQFYNEEGKIFEYEELVINNCPQCAECSTVQTNLRWELNGNKIDFYFGETYVLQYEIVSVSETTFTYRFQFDIDNDNEIEVVEVASDYYDPYNNFD